MSDSTEIKQQLEMINQNLKMCNQRLVEHDRRFDEHDRRFDEHDRRFDDLSNEFREFRILQEEQAAKLDKVLDVVLHINDRLAKHDNLVATVEDHGHRIAALESTVRRSP